MKTTRKWLSILVMAMVALPGSAFAQEGKPLGALKEGQGVTHVLRDAGCGFNWVSQAVRDSKIDPAKLRQLPVGREVYLNVLSCKEAPPQAVAEASRVMLRTDMSQEANTRPAGHNQSAEIQKLHDAIALGDRKAEQLRSDNDRFRVDAEKLVGDLKSQVATLQADKTKLALQANKVAQLQADLSKAAATQLGLLALMFLGGLIVGGVGVGLFAWQRWRKATGPLVMFKKVETIKRDDGAATYCAFKLVGVTYKCVVCGEEVTSRGDHERHLQMHAREQHPVVVLGPRDLDKDRQVS